MPTAPDAVAASRVARQAAASAGKSARTHRSPERASSSARRKRPREIRSQVSRAAPGAAPDATTATRHVTAARAASATYGSPSDAATQSECAPADSRARASAKSSPGSPESDTRTPMLGAGEVAPGSASADLAFERLTDLADVRRGLSRRAAFREAQTLGRDPRGERCQGGKAPFLGVRHDAGELEDLLGHLRMKLPRRDRRAAFGRVFGPAFAERGEELVHLPKSNASVCP